MSLLGRAASRLLTVGVTAVLAVGALAPVGAARAVALPALPAAPASQVPTSYISVDADTGTVIAAKDEHQALPPASTIKLLTALTALDHLPMDSTVPVTARAAAQPAMKINMTAGSVWPFDQALHALLIVSANDAAYAIAERVGGSIEGFAPIAQAEAQQLGLVDTTFRDPAGLDDGGAYAGGSRTSAFDLAIVARNALAVPQIANTSKLLHYEFTDPNGVGRSLTNHNKGFLGSYPGATGLKTGYTKLASRTLVSTATRNGRTCLAVNMGSWDDTGWAGYLLDQCFAAAPGATGTGVKLPPVRAVTADARLAVYRGLPPVLGRPALGTTGAGAAPGTATASNAASHAAPGTASSTATSTTRARAAPAKPAKPAPRPGSGATVDAQNASSTTAAGGAGGLALGSLLRTLLVALVLLGLVLFLLRRRAVRRRRNRRLARQKALAEQRRRRMIDVVELRDRESGGHVRVMRSQETAAGSRRR